MRWGICLAILVAPAAAETIVDVSSQSSIVVHTGDTLVFQLLTWNFALNAARQNLPLYPTDVDFALISAPLSGVGEFAATVESADGKVSMDIGELTFGAGYLESSGYTGAVSELTGHLSLSLLESEALFNGSSIFIEFLNEGPTVTLDLAPYLLRQDLLVSLSEGPLSVGAMTGSVELESPDSRVSSTKSSGALSFSSDSTVPEPQTAGLLFGGGAVLCGISALLARVGRRRK